MKGRRQMMTRTGVLALLSVALAACGGSSTISPDDTSTPSGDPSTPAGQGITVGVRPESITTTPQGVVPFAGAVTGSANLSVIWDVVETGGGTVDATGRYTAPATTGQYHVRVRSAADPTIQALAAVNVTASTGANTSTLQVSGRYLLDTCGNHLVIRGVEQPFGLGMESPAWDPATNPAGGTLNNTLDQIAATGANSIRFMANLSQLSLTQLDDFFARITGHGMVIFWSLSYVPNGMSDHDWWAQQSVKNLVAKYSKWIIIDAAQEYTADDRAGWRTTVLAEVAWFRAQGYTVPLDVIANHYGRDLVSILETGPAGVPVGQEIVNSDPLHRVILGWQAYWFDTGHTSWAGGWTYQEQYGMTMAQAVTAVAAQNFPIQMGIEYFTENDPNGPYMNYEVAMAAAQANNVGWLWWDYYNPFGADKNDLTTNGMSTAGNLTSFGAAVINSSANGLKNTSHKACGL